MIAPTKRKSSAAVAAAGGSGADHAKGDESLSNVMYLGRFPHGFYEKQIAEYFSQFGTVLKVRVSRNPKTGNSRGFAFVEFKHGEVAKIAASTMNGYLMFKQKLVCHVVTNDYVSARPNLFRDWQRRWDPQMQRHRKRAQKVQRVNGRVRDTQEYYEFLRRFIARDERCREKVASEGIDYDWKPAKSLVDKDSPFWEWCKGKEAELAADQDDQNELNELEELDASEDGLEEILSEPEIEGLSDLESDDDVLEVDVTDVPPAKKAKKAKSGKSKEKAKESYGGMEVSVSEKASKLENVQDSSKKKGTRGSKEKKSGKKVPGVESVAPKKSPGVKQKKAAKGGKK